MATRIEKLERKMNPRSLTESERPWIEKWNASRPGELVGKAIEVGLTRQVAWGIVGYLADRAAGEPSDVVASETRARYRKLLALIGPPIMFDSEAA